MKILVLRLGHRFARDKRISTHLGLVARAFGADELVMDVWDSHVEESVDKVVDEWGGQFKMSFISDWKKYVREFRGDRIHLTMYGLNLNQLGEKIISSKKDKLIIVGGKKVPAEIYNMVDYNIAVGNQPHSEVAALATFLDRLFDGGELDKDFKGKKRIIPQEKGKKVV